MQMQPTSEFKDRFIAPEMSSFTTVAMKDLTAVSDEQGHWLLNFVLNSSLRAQMDGPDRQRFFNLLRRTEAAFREYELARSMTLAHLAQQNPNAVSEYLLAIGHWEVFLSHTYQAYCLLVMGRPVLFDKSDGTALQRLNLLYNRSKHAESAIASRQLPEDGTLPVWLKDDGLHSIDSHLTFDEIADILETLARLADVLQDPLTVTEDKLKAALMPDGEAPEAPTSA
jgi:hypothetical protein